MFDHSKWIWIAGPLLGLSLIVFIIPMPTFLLDALVVLQWFISVSLLLLVWVNQSLSTIAKLPSWLISITLIRLGINIVTTRSILLQAKAGGVIEQAGEWLMGERWSVGLVFFFGLLSVQYLVVAKGLERIAQLTARFNLEALPGAQQAIVTQQAQGQIHPEKARRLRQVIEARSLRSSSIEGVLKFIKGEQLASLCLILINLFGGAWAGHYHEQLEFHYALSLYGKLAIGDGLLAQLPALYCSMAATLYITRLLNPNSDILEQPYDRCENDMKLSQVLLSSSLALLCIGLLPIWTTESRWVIFVELTIFGLGVVYLTYIRPLMRMKGTVGKSSKSSQASQSSQVSKSNHLISPQTNGRIVLSLSYQHLESIGGGLAQLKILIDQKRVLLGLPKRKIDFILRPNDPDPHRLELHLDQELIAVETVPAHSVLSLYQEQFLPTTLHPYKGVLGVWRPQDQHPLLLTELSFETWLSEWLIYHWCSFKSLTWSAEEAWIWLNQGTATLREEALTHDLSILKLTDLLRDLSAEACALKHADHVLEGLIRARQNIQNCKQEWQKELRSALGMKALLGGYSAKELSALWIEVKLNEHASRFEIQAVLNQTLEQIQKSSDAWKYEDSFTVLMIDEKYRSQCQALSRQILPGLRVLSPQEVPAHVKLKVLKVFTYQDSIY